MSRIPRTPPAVLLLDLDGTLIDSLPTMRGIYNTFLERNGRRGSDEEFERLNGPTLSRIVALLKDWHDLPQPYDELLREYGGAVERGYCEHVPAADGAEAVLRWTRERSARVGLVTSTPRWLVTPILKRLRWTDAFEFTVCGDEVPEAKPSPDVYLLATQRSGSSARDCLAVEDAFNGVRAAVAAAVPVIGLGHPIRHVTYSELGALAVIERLAELPVLLDSAR